MSKPKPSAVLLGPCECGWLVPTQIEIGVPEAEESPSAFMLRIYCPKCKKPHVLIVPVQS